MKRILSCVLALLGLTALARAADPAGLSTEFIPGQGFRVTAAGVPLVMGSALQLYAPGWKEGYYTSAKVDARHDAEGWTLQHHAPDVGFDATETLKADGDTRLDWTVGGVLKSDKPVRLEWMIGRLNGSAIKKIEEGNQRVVLETAAGRVTVKVESGAIDLALLEGKRNTDRWWAQAGPAYWLGVLGAEPKQNEPFTYHVSLTLEPKAIAKPAPDVTASVPVVAAPKAFAARSQPVRVIPKPKSLTLGGGRFALGPETSLLAVDQASLPGVMSLVREARERFGWTWKTLAAEHATPRAGTIIFQRASAEKIPAEGYAIHATPTGIVVTATDQAGYFYAAQTLAQLIQIEDDTTYLPACKVLDWPSLAFRGVHLFPGKDAMDVHRRLIERVVARFKMNHVVLEADYGQWSVDKKMWTDISVPTRQLAEYVRVARDNMVEPIPLVQSLGHMEWMFKNGENRDLAEDPETPYAYSVTNPNTYEFIENVYNEAISLFGSKWFHIGHDEVAMRGRYPYRDAAKQLGEEKLFLSDTNQLHDWLKSRDTGTMMWGDVLLAKDESNDAAANAKDVESAKRMRAAIPRDTIICDWHYTPTDWWNYKSLKVFHDEGFKTIACTWSNPRNIFAFAEAARKYGALGLLQTTWAGYSINGKTIADAPEQFAAYVLAAEYAWSADSPPPADLGWDPGEVFARAMDPAKAETGAKPGWMLNLSAVPDAETPDKRVLDLDNLYADDRRGNHLFWSTGDGYPAVVLAGSMLPGDKPSPATVTMHCALPAGVTEIAFLHATAFPATPGEVVGGYEILYADGTTLPVALTYGKNIRAVTDAAPTPDAEPAWTGKTTQGDPATLRVFRLKNIYPEKPITGVRFSTRHPYASPLLLGVTAVE